MSGATLRLRHPDTGNLLDDKSIPLGAHVDVERNSTTIGTGRLVGWMHRERVTYGGSMLWFRIGITERIAAAALDVALPLVETLCGEGLLAMPACPDCASELQRRATERAAWRCDGCGSAFVDGRFGAVVPVPAG